MEQIWWRLGESCGSEVWSCTKWLRHPRFRFWLVSAVALSAQLLSHAPVSCQIKKKMPTKQRWRLHLFAYNYKWQKWVWREMEPKVAEFNLDLHPKLWICQKAKPSTKFRHRPTGMKIKHPEIYIHEWFTFFGWDKNINNRCKQGKTNNPKTDDRGDFQVPWNKHHHG